MCGILLEKEFVEKFALLFISCVAKVGRNLAISKRRIKACVILGLMNNCM